MYVVRRRFLKTRIRLVLGGAGELGFFIVVYLGIFSVLCYFCRFVYFACLLVLWVFRSRCGSCRVVGSSCIRFGS